MLGLCWDNSGTVLSSINELFLGLCWDSPRTMVGQSWDYVGNEDFLKILGILILRMNFEANF